LSSRPEPPSSPAQPAAAPSSAVTPPTSPAGSASSPAHRARPLGDEAHRRRRARPERVGRPPLARADAASGAPDGRLGVRPRPHRRPAGQTVSAELVLDTPVVRAFVADVEAAIAAASTPQQACETIRPRFAELLADPGWLPPAYRAPAPESGMGGGIGQWLLYRAGDGSLSLFSLVVPPGSETPIHDHLAWGPRRPLPRHPRRGDLRAAERRARARREASPGAGRLLCPDPAARRHPPRADHLSRDLGVDPPAHERHRLRVATRIRRCVGRGEAIPLGLRQRRLLVPRTRFFLKSYMYAPAVRYTAEPSRAAGVDVPVVCNIRRSRCGRFEVGNR
jgi:hypothetical protein